MLANYKRKVYAYEKMYTKTALLFDRCFSISTSE